MNVEERHEKDEVDTPALIRSIEAEEESRLGRKRDYKKVTPASEEEEGQHTRVSQTL